MIDLEQEVERVILVGVSTDDNDDTEKSLDELEELVLMDLGMESVGLVRLGDVANIEILDNSDETYAVVNGNPSVTLSFEKQTGYSTGEVTDRLLDKFESLEKQNEALNRELRRSIDEIHALRDELLRSSHQYSMPQQPSRLVAEP